MVNPVAISMKYSIYTQTQNPQKYYLITLILVNIGIGIINVLDWCTHH